MTEKGIVLCTACLDPYKGTLRRSLTNWNTAIAFSLGRPSSSNNLIFAGSSMHLSPGSWILRPAMTVFASSRLYSSSYLYVPFGLLPSQEPCQESLDLPLVGHQGSAIWSGSNWDYRLEGPLQRLPVECPVEQCPLSTGLVTAADVSEGIDGHFGCP
ncbi:hypothetical protein WJX82_009501 [Trebouxia sp. C0006]